MPDGYPGRGGRSEEKGSILRKTLRTKTNRPSEKRKRGGRLFGRKEDGEEVYNEEMEPRGDEG